MNPVATQLFDLKLILQDLESAVQQPRDEGDSLNNILERFPRALMGFKNVLRDVLMAHGHYEYLPAQVFTEAHKRGWLKGDLSLWLRLLSDYQEITAEVQVHSAKGRAVAQDVRACSYMFWETFELLTARFRYQTQSMPVSKIALSGPSLTQMMLQSV